MKVALVYDRVNKWGGAERVLLALHELFPQAPLYTSVYDAKKAPWAKVFQIKTSFLQNIPGAKKNHELLAPLMPFAFERFNFDKYDLVISVTSEAAKGIITHSGTMHICYCLTPTRYLWSGFTEYFKNKSLSILLRPVINALRKWDLVASTRPDVFIAISKEVQGRIKKYYGRESELVYPPATLSLARRAGPPVALGEREKGKGESNLSASPFTLHSSPYFLVVSRLSKFTRYKRVDLAIEACNELQLPLKIIGEGNLRKELEKEAGPTIEFIGKVSDRELVDYYKNCKALIFPGREDLGLVMIEAQMQGKPVIAFKAGGALELVTDPSASSHSAGSGQAGSATGLFFDRQTKESLGGVLKKFESIKFNEKTIIKNAKQYDFENFKKNFLSVVNNSIKHYNK
jgi:glycosyltransferase involved in cell wall biosynthesis